MSAIPPQIAELVAKFEQNLGSYRNPAYGEAEVRIEFLNPLFDALGWDMANKAGYAEAYKDVIHEDAIKVGGATKAPDYSFRIGGARKFFLEAKRPSLNIKDESSSAYQLRRYSWSAKLPLSILTNFAEFAVYDCRLPPRQIDKASKERVFYLTYKEYADRWEEVASIFSKEAVLRGSFDRFAETGKGKRGTSPVDKEFLSEIESWREDLAKNLAVRNPRLSVRDLNFAVQRTIDRIIFLRMCEDRSIESYGQLQALLNGENTYKRLHHLYRLADEKYNSGLFHFEEEKDRAEAPDKLTLNLKIEDKVLKDIIRRLYYPDSPYEFSVLGADILGNVYEQFLGKVIRLTAGHRAVVEEKPEVKKAGGIYYTPAYIVDYIVKNTVGKLCEGKAPREISKLRILDPACGSGSFLIGAYKCLLDYHRDWYFDDGPQKHAKEIYRGAGGHWYLTTQEKKRILLNNIYGVDIDSQAVEVTKLSLLLKVLEGENHDSLTRQLKIWRERALPDLGNNIKCGNTLIGPDFYKNQQMSLLDDEERYRINVFDWHSEFPAIMKSGGFDTVIGNPPYVRSQSLGVMQREYYGQKYQTATATYDIYVLFVERAISLIKDQGKCGFILPNKFFTTDYGEGLRMILGRQHIVEKLVDFEDAQVFDDAGTYTTLLFLSGSVTSKTDYAKLGSVFRSAGSAGLASALASPTLSFAPLILTEDGSRWTLAAGLGGKVLIRLQQTLPTFAALRPHIFQGLKTSADKIYILKVQRHRGALSDVMNGLDERFTIEQDILKPIVKGENVQRFSIDLSDALFIIYPYSVDSSGRASLLGQGELSKKFPRTWEYLKAQRRTLGARDAGEWEKREDWYAYARSQNIGTFPGPKLLVPYMTTRLRAASDDEGQLFFVNITTGGYGFRIRSGQHHNLYVLAILNSALLNYCVQQMTNRFRGGYFAVNKQALERLPFRQINFSDRADNARHDEMVSLVERMLTLQKNVAAVKNPNDKTRLQREIEATDRQIDQLVYDLYGLTEEEIKIVEEKA